MTTKITQPYVFISVDADGNEGIIGMRTDDGWMPLVFSDLHLVDLVKARIDHIKRGLDGKRAKLITFTHREDLEDL